MKKNIDNPITIIGAGLAGCEAALVLAALGHKVQLFDAKPKHFSPAHKNKNLAEVVCSNSFKSNDITTGGGLLKQELRVLGSPLLACADACSLPAGGALAVDRDIFSQKVTEKILSQPNIEFSTRLVDSFDKDKPLIIATGPLTLSPLSKVLEEFFGGSLYFFDAVAPIVWAGSIDYSKTFFASRYNKGEGHYLNCPLTKDEYEIFVKELISAQRVIKHDFEMGEIFAGCMPIEEVARRGEDSLRFGALKPVGLYDKDGKRPYAVVQLRQENAAGDMYNLVGFQTNLKFFEQKRVFGLIPALKTAEFLRYGVMHRNIFIDAPKVLDSDLSVKGYPYMYVAGQLSGVEGYVESIASGHIMGLLLSAKLKEKNIKLPSDTMIGALCQYLTRENQNFQPMNANFGLMPPLESHIKDKKQRKAALSSRALEKAKKFLSLYKQS